MRGGVYIYKVHYIRSVYLILAMGIALSTQAQFPPIDAIREKARKAPGDKAELTAILELARYRNSLNADTAAVYFTRAKQIALRYNDERSLRWAEYLLLAGELTKGKTDSVLLKLDANPVFRFPKAEDPELYYKLRLLKANVLNRTNEKAKAIEWQLLTLTEAEKDKNLLAQCFLRNYIGASYINSGKSAEARAIWLETLLLLEGKPDEKLKEIEVTIYSNLALYYFQQLYSSLKQPITDSFLLYNNIVIRESRLHDIYWLLPTALSYRGEYYGLQQMWKEGEADFREAVSIRNRIGDPLYTINDMVRLASFYGMQKQYDSAINVLQESIQVIKKTHINEALVRVSALLGYMYKQKGDYKAYSAALEQFILDADTAVRMNAADRINEIMARYDVQKKETLIANQKLELAQRKLYIIVTSLLFVLSLILFYFYFREYKRKQSLRNAEAVLDAENRERKRIAAELHDNMGVHANAILHNASMLGNSASGNAPLIHNLQETAKEMLGSLRETVWALKSTDVTCAETWLRLVNFIQQSKRNFSGIGFSISGAAPDTVLITSVKALHIIMVIKEAVTNSIKHAEAERITITGTYAGQWEIRVEDNGKGFDLDRQQSGAESNGLLNMKDRALAGKFSVTVQSEPGKGTAVVLLIPV